MIALVLTCVLAAAPPPPSTVAEVVAAAQATATARKYSEEKAARNQDKALLRFALDDRFAAKERWSASAQLVALRQRPRAKRSAIADAMLVKARLEGLLGREKQRAKTLAAATAELQATKRKRLLRMVERLVDDDKTYLRFARRRKRAFGDDEKKDLDQLTAGLKNYTKLQDRPRALKIALTLADRKSAAAGVEPQDVARFYDLTGWAPKGRDAAADRARARRRRADAFEASGQITDAIAQHMLADREDPRPPDDTALTAPTTTRSQSTSRLCYAARTRNIDCAKLEVQKFGARTFFDFGDVKTDGFDPEIAGWVFSEYQSLVHGCLIAAGKSQEAAGSVEVEWSIANSGKVTAFDVRPRRLRQGPFHACLKRAFETFRYPPYPGEMQHIALSFEVHG